MSPRQAVRGLMLAALLSVAVSPAHAAQNSAARVRAFARLPDWTGIWLSDSEQSDLGGRANTSPFQFIRPPPYNPEWEAKHQARLARSKTKATAEAPTIRQCIIDFPATMESPQPFNLIVTPEETVFTAGDGTFRHIFTDGRGHPAKDDLWPTITGHSIGHWEGQTLVVDTVARSPGPDRYLGLAAYSEAAHFTERIRMTGKDRLEDQMTIDDPVAFTHPWTLTLGFGRISFIDRLDPYYCELDDRTKVVDGKLVIVPPPDEAGR